MKILLNSDIDFNEWNFLVKNNAMLRIEWRNIIKESYDLKPFYMLIKEDNSFAMVGSFQTGKGYISLPFLGYSGYKYSDFKMFELLRNNLKKNKIEIDARNKIPFNESIYYITSIINIDSFDIYWKNLSTNMRNQIKKSQTYGFEIKVEKKLSQEAYRLYAKAMHRLGTPVHKKLFFDKILEHIPESFVMIISDKSKIIGFMLSVYDDETLYDLFAATDTEYNKKYANYFLYYEMLKYTHEKGLKYFDMGRSTLDSSVHKFKLKWNPIDFSVTSSFVYNKNSSLGLISRLWQKLPFALTLWLGPKLRKYLP